MSTYRVTIEGFGYRMEGGRQLGEDFRRVLLNVEARDPQEARQRVFWHPPVVDDLTGRAFMPISEGLGGRKGFRFDEFKIVRTRKIA